MSYPAQYAVEPVRKRPRRAVEETRSRAIRAAVDQISEFGFHKMTIADVAAKTGVSQSGLLHHFPSKAALLTAVLDQRERDDRDFLFRDGTVPLGWAAFDALVSLAARNSTRPEWVGVFVRVAAEATEPGHPAREWLTRHYESTRRWLTEALHHGIANGEIVPNAPVDLIVGNTIACLDGIQQQWTLEPGRVSMVNHVREHVRALKAAWSTDTPS